MNDTIEGAAVLITGGTGTFGKTMAKHLLASGCERVRVFSRDEAKQDDMRRLLADDRLEFHIGDVRDADAVRRACRDVEYVFHAAALKQVPSCEFFPLEALRTNVLGSANLIEAAVSHGVRGVVCLSTDKAVYPVNAMGMTKALMEKVAQAHARGYPGSPTRVSCVRYGNVMCSRGSVIPLFIEQVKEGRPLTVTHESMTRFLMSLDDSVRLVEHAFTYAKPGDVFIRKASACTIGDLAAAVCTLFGVPVKYNALGIRHGEKMSETLVSREEMAQAEDLGEFFRVPVDSRDLNYALYFDEGDSRGDYVDDYTSANARRLDVQEIMDLLMTLPEVRAELAMAAA